MDNFEKEIWKDIKGFEGLYRVSNLGRVKSLKRPYRLKEKILKPLITKGYYQVELCKNSIAKFYKVHRLVWEAFNGSIPENMQVNHLNEIKTDNRLENLNLMTAKENLNWGTRNKRMAKSKSKPVLQFDLNDNLIKEFPSLIQVYRELGFSYGNIGYCCNGKLKQAYGFKWRYKPFLEPLKEKRYNLSSDSYKCLKW